MEPVISSGGEYAYPHDRDQFRELLAAEVIYHCRKCSSWERATFHPEAGYTIEDIRGFIRGDHPLTMLARAGEDA